MNDEYLWNKTGRDPEVRALEELLSPLGHGRRREGAPPPKPRRGWGLPIGGLAVAAVLLLFLRPWGPPAPSGEGPRTAAREIDLKQYGTVHAREGAVVSVLRQSDEDIRLRLERGTIEARITLAARPRLFQVETPATLCVDLGCHYTLTVEDDGSTFVRVDQGEVAFVDGGRETWIPRGASCRASPARGSGTPRWDDGGPHLLAAIERLDAASHGGPGESSGRTQAALEVIAACREPRDALSLWHLTGEPVGALREAAWSALTELAGLPAGVADPRAEDAREDWKRHLLGIFEAAELRR
ncbi:MAG: FecR domain-containing protein [Planctomycetes bacterium]|nr:FecR domain-containing protein [Planctomycetota bacterium]